VTRVASICWQVVLLALCSGVVINGLVPAAAWNQPEEIDGFVRPEHADPPTDPMTNDGHEPPVLERDEPVELRRLTPEEVNRIRFMELRAMRMDTADRPDAVRVEISRETHIDFLLDMEGHPLFRGERTRRAFNRLTPAQKLHQIAYHQREKYADRVKILTDPEIFVQWKTEIMPVVLRSCATSGCHAPASNPEQVYFRLFKDPKRLPETTYANFIILNDIERDPHRMIDRGAPEQSLLLTYMLPKKEVRPELRHPGDVAYRPVFRSRKNPRFRRFARWIGSLKIPQSDYGVRLVPLPPPLYEPSKDRPPDEPSADVDGDATKDDTAQ